MTLAKREIEANLIEGKIDKKNNSSKTNRTTTELKAPIELEELHERDVDKIGNRSDKD